MAVSQTGAIYKTLTFDGVSSGTYGVYITGQAVYNAPEREVEMISIPGRSGQLALDKGRFENIEVTYPAGIFADTEADFAEAISNFRNLLCSRRGYVRLQDEYNPNEYRMAVYKSGLEVENALLKAGQFDIVFDCKPQRWLTSGETALDVDSGDVVSNPTLFDASPLLLSNGYGDITIGDDTLTIEQTLVGEIQLLNSGATSASVNLANTEKLNAGDSIYEKKYSGITTAETRLEISFKNIDNHPSNGVIATSGCTVTKFSNQIFTMEFDPGISFVYGTASQVNASFTIRVRINSSPVDVSFTASILYDGHKNLRFTRTSSPATLPGTAYVNKFRYWGNFFGDSTKSALPNPLYIDLDLGEAYGDIGGSITSLNNAVRLPAALPKLKPGATTVTYDGTITSLQVVPRWWKV